MIMKRVVNYAVIGAATLSLATLGNLTAFGQTAGTQGAATGGGISQNEPGIGATVAGQTNAGQQGAAGQAQVGIGGQANVNQGNLPYQPFGQNPWFANPAVQQQFRLNQNQYNQLGQAYRNNYDQFQSRLRALPDLTPDESQRRYAELYGNFRSNLYRDVDSVITDPRQRARFNQLHTQYQFYDAFTDPSVQQRLNLNAQQMQQLRAYRQEWANELQQLRNVDPDQREAARRRYQQLRSDFSDRINQMMTDPAQRQAWLELYGEPYEFDYNLYFNTPGTTQGLNMPPANSGANVGGTPGSGIGTAQNPGTGSGIGTAQNPGTGSGIGTGRD
jgi:hypothetical protein